MIDFHAHLDLYPTPESVVSRCADREMYVLSVTNTPSAWPGTSSLAAAHPRIRTALGLHPQLARERRFELPLFDRYLTATRYVGEIGLDGGQEFKDSWSDQFIVFTHILKSCAKHGGRVMSIHSRRAATPVLNLLEQHGGAGIPVLHWFSGTSRELMFTPLEK